MDKKNGRNGRKARRGGTGKQDTCTNREAGCCYLKEDLNELQMYHANSTKNSKKIFKHITDFPRGQTMK